MSLLALLLALPAAQEAEVALHPRAIVDAEGRLVEGRYVRVRDGRIRGVDTAPGRAPVLELDGVLAPGFVDAFTTNGAAGRVSEESARLTPALRAADAADFDHEIWLERARHGVTSAHLVPEPSNVLAGLGALLATQGTPRRIAASTVQVASLTSWIYDERVGPTALAGGLELLGEAFAAKDPSWRGSGLLCFVENAEGIRGVREACERAGLRRRHFVLTGDVGSYGGEAAQELVGMSTLYGSDARTAETLRLLHGAGVRIAFGTFGGDADPAALRASALTLARVLDDPGAAWASVTRNSAELLGLEQDVGVIAEGARADLVLWTGHPLDAAARVQTVMIGGRMVDAALPRER